MTDADIELEAKQLWGILTSQGRGRSRSIKSRSGTLARLQFTWWNNAHFLFLEAHVDHNRDNDMGIPLTGTFDRYMERFKEVCAGVHAARTLRSVGSLK